MNIKDRIRDVLRPAYRHYLAYRHKGERYECNICNHKYDTWRPTFSKHADGSYFRVYGRPCGPCWLCNSYPRIRLIWHWLMSDFEIANKHDFKVLHVAPEIQISQQLRKIPGLQYYCVDKHCDGYTYPSYVEDGDVRNLKFSDNTFDLVMCNHVLEHVIDDSTAIKELYRVTKPEGTALLIVPLDYERSETDEERPEESLTPEQREERFGQHDHVRIYGTDYFDRLRAVGFTVNLIEYNDKDMVERYGFLPGEKLIICTK